MGSYWLAGRYLRRSLAGPRGLDTHGAIRLEMMLLTVCPVSSPTRVRSSRVFHSDSCRVLALSVKAVTVETLNPCEGSVTRCAMAGVETVPASSASATMGIGRIEVVHDGTSQNVANPHSITAGVRMIDLQGVVVVSGACSGGFAGLRRVFVWVQPLRGLESSTPSKKGWPRPRGMRDGTTPVCESGTKPEHGKISHGLWENLP